MRVACDVETRIIHNAEGDVVEGVKVTCSRCGHSQESYGTSDKSIRRCCALLGKTCPEGESNFYVVDE